MLKILKEGIIVSDELKKYVANARSAGFNDGAIQAKLIESGYSAEQAALALQKEPPVVPGAPTTPTPPLAPAMPAITAPRPAVPSVPAVAAPSPVAPTTPPSTEVPVLAPLKGADEPKRPRWLSFVAIVVIIIVFGIAALLLVQNFRNNQNNQTSSTTQTTVPPITYSGTGFSFDYNSSWQHQAMAVLLEAGSSTADDPQFFFTSDAYTQVQQLVAAAKATPSSDASGGISIIFQVAAKSSLVVTPTGKDVLTFSGVPGAQGAAQDATKSTCSSDGSASFNSETPVDQSRISTITVGGKTAYAVTGAANNNCTGYQVFIDLTDGSRVKLAFTGSSSAASLTADQQGILNSFKIL